ncbi:mRNA turnover protein 4 homolog, partial [Uloborus diversus]|uniref:mRNA turnover protein 4 homolog n=1 Tax=Uloborus diversus TaxID=327109 RepID=UPI00240A8982
MPISKRNKQVELSKTKKQGLERKKKLHEEIRSSVDKYEHIFVFSVTDMRNAKMKTVREQWRHSRFFIGKNKVMAYALGRTLEDEYQPNLHKVSQMLQGQCGLLFSNQPVDEVLRWFTSYSEGVYARSGNIATDDVILKEGPLSQFPHSLEPELRRLGLPTTLTKGIVHLVKDHEVCKVGDSLTPEAAKILEHLGYEMAEFQIKIQCTWSRDGSFMDLRTEMPEEGSGKKKKRRSKSKKRLLKTENHTDVAKMEIIESEELATELEKSATKLETELAFEDSKENIKQEVKSPLKPSKNAKNIVVDEDEEMEVVEQNGATKQSPVISNRKEVSNISFEHHEPVKNDAISSDKKIKWSMQNCSTPMVKSVC